MTEDKSPGGQGLRLVSDRPNVCSPGLRAISKQQVNRLYGQLQGHGDRTPQRARRAAHAGSVKPMTGFYGDSCCNPGREDIGSHTVCAVMTSARYLMVLSILVWPSKSCTTHGLSVLR
jgi:hypothetical protein